MPATAKCLTLRSPPDPGPSSTPDTQLTASSPLLQGPRSQTEKTARAEGLITRAPPPVGFTETLVRGPWCVSPSARLFPSVTFCLGCKPSDPSSLPGMIISPVQGERTSLTASNPCLRPACGPFSPFKPAEAGLLKSRTESTPNSHPSGRNGA